MADEHRCSDGTCILMEYLCDNRPDCRDMSDEANCGEFNTRSPLLGRVCEAPVQRPGALTLSDDRFRIETTSGSGLHDPSHHNHPYQEARGPQTRRTLQGGSGHLPERRMHPPGLHL